ncbi:hypothetical protein SCOR_00550 [Sulfidibacter corallicola]|uniref:ABM domain-containing protein n=1 Tax=Sulfidibacter corallicola TaxID=2818388 RepID=A0A8A4TIH1_SULCO|nr:antibiotic biosynthesis monooxygenase [Sulfidibacter corallicola]QTD48984.1 hypothetical protein J3U87_25650 [Sulfidibacter corallicola]
MIRFLIRYDIEEANLAEIREAVAAFVRYIDDHDALDMSYQSLKSEEGFHFTHIATFRDESHLKALQGSEAFKTFSGVIKKCAVNPPAASRMTLIGATEKTF